MPTPSSERTYDLVLLGATGFTGILTAEYLARHAPDGCRWALAGRSQARLEAVRARLVAIDPGLADLPLLTADVADPASLRALARSTRVLATTVGPYLVLGEPVVAACAESGTDYLDLTGEPEFVDRMYLAHHERATRTGARLVHCCGFDSVPHDLGVLFTVRRLPAGVPLTVRGVVRSAGAFSGGTLDSALGQLGRAGPMRAAAARRREVEPRPEGRRARGRWGAPGKDPVLGYWLLPLPTIDPLVVKRSAAARADYGPDFAYTHHAGFRSLVWAGAGAAGAVGLAAAAQVPPLRGLLHRGLTQGGDPSEDKRDRSWFTVELVGEGGGETVVTTVRGGDPGYTETARMLGEAALCLALDDNPVTAGQVTTAAAMGEHLIERLIESGISFTSERIAP